MCFRIGAHQWYGEEGGERFRSPATTLQLSQCGTMLDLGCCPPLSSGGQPDTTLMGSDALSWVLGVNQTLADGLQLVLTPTA